MVCLSLEFQETTVSLSERAILILKYFVSESFLFQYELPFKFSECYRTQVWLLVAQESTLRDKCWIKEKIALLRKLALLGRKGTLALKEPTPNCQSGAKSF